MLTTVERLIDGVVQTLTEAVLPDVATPFARGQLYAAVDVLRNLRDRIEPRADLAEAESDSAAAALAGALAALDGAPALPDAASAVASRIRSALASTPAAPPATRTAALRAALVEALTAIAALPDDVARPARAPIAQHLGAQAMRDVAVLKPSMLGEISRG
jgi:hypothetical protein